MTTIHDAINATSPHRGDIVTLPPGIFEVTSPIIFPNDGRQVTLRGAGRSATILIVPRSFIGGPGVIQLQNSNESKPTVERLGIHFEQPDTSQRTDLIQYPPAIYAQGGGRFTIRDVAIVRAWDGIDARGPNGGMIVQNVEMSHFNKGIQINGSFDTNEFSDIHQWVFGLSPQQSVIYKQPETVGFEVGRVDGLLLSNSFSYAGTGYRFYADPQLGGPSPAMLSNCMADQNTGIVVEGGSVLVSNFAMGVYPDGAHGILVTGGHAQLSNVVIHLGREAKGRGVITVTGGVALLNNVRINSFWWEAVHVEVTGGFASFDNSYFERAIGVTYTEPVVKVTGGRIAVMGSRFKDSDLNTPSPGIQIINDDWHLLANNTLLGSWVHALPPPGCLRARGNVGIADQ